MNDVTPPIRLRFAPSPTGMFHVGSARSALFNWLYVRRFGGQLVLRIEDTDEARNKPEWITGITEAMSWLGINWDEGPNFQSANKSQHVEACERLFQAGCAYYCDCTRDAIDARAKAAHRPPGYDGNCRDRSLGPGEGRVLRFRVPSGSTTVHDLIRGDVEFAHEHIEDFVILRSNGAPMFVVANVVDDILERITHVVRGEEHLPNTPKQLLMWSVLAPELAPGLVRPTYAHLPVIVNEKRQKLSKRRDKVSLEMYRDEGYLPEAMRNYLALLGWAPKGDREIVTVETLIDEFDFADVQKSSAFFDIAKLNHFNGEYIRALDVAEFIRRCKPFLDAEGFPCFDESVFTEMAPLAQTRVDRLVDVAPMVRFLFVHDVEPTEEARSVMKKPEAHAILRSAIEQFASLAWDVESLHACVQVIGEAQGWKLGKAQAPIRAAVTGAKVGPPLFESIALLGRERTLDRLRSFAQLTDGMASS